MNRHTVNTPAAGVGGFGTRLGIMLLLLMLPMLGSASQLHGLVLNQAQAEVARRIENELATLIYLGDHWVNGNLAITEERLGLGAIQIQVNYQGVVLKKIIQRQRALPRARIVQLAGEIYQKILKLDALKRREVIERLQKTSIVGN